ncbi:MAG: hypothetical protein ABIT96_01440 [Ferruginibacter sp.]
MKITVFLSLFVSSLLFLTSCDKEYSVENGIQLPATGSLKAVSGDCQPAVVNGIYRAGSPLDVATNYIDVNLEATAIGYYRLYSDTVNGMYFKASGNIYTTGNNAIRLTSYGTPLTTGTYPYTISFNGSECVIDVLVVDASTAAATFSLQTGTGGACSGAVVSGIYKVNTILDGSNTVQLSVNVTAAGTWNISVPSSNGMIFSGAGVFTTTGIKTIVLGAIGTPSTAGNFNFSVPHSGATCTFSVTVVTNTGINTPGNFTLGGAPGNCTGAVLSGTYMQGIALTASNTAKVNLNVTGLGTYNLTTNTVNGVKFTAIGNFSSTGALLLTLVGSGTPTAQGPFTYKVYGKTDTCSFQVTFLPPAAPAVFTLVGAPNTCTAPTIAGVYSAGTAMTTGNTVTIKANVTTAGSYSISTPTVNGIQFTGSGLLAAGASVPIVLTATGTPVVAGTNTFAPSFSGSFCTFDIVTTGVASATYQCKINGVLNTFNVDAYAEVFDATTGDRYLYMDGFTNSTITSPEFTLYVEKNDNSVVGTGTYNVDGFALPNGYLLGAQYTNATGVNYQTSSTIPGSPASPAFSILVTSVTTSRVMGSFSGKLGDSTGTLVTITEGIFNLPIQ